MGFYSWITEGVRRAIMRGIEEAAAEINEAGSEAEIRLHLPAHREPLRLPHEEPSNGNGRRKLTPATR